MSARSLKLSNAGPGSQLDGWPPGLPGAAYTRTCLQRCCVLGLREPRKSVWMTKAGRKIISMDVVSIRRDPTKSTISCDSTRFAIAPWAVSLPDFEVVLSISLQTNKQTDKHTDKQYALLRVPWSRPKATNGKMTLIFPGHFSSWSH